MRVGVSESSAPRRWRIRAIRHVTIQLVGFVVLFGIAVALGVDDHWAEAGVFALLSVFPAMVLAALIQKIHRVRLQRCSWTKHESV
jgi:hypothetical protein